MEKFIIDKYRTIGLGMTNGAIMESANASSLPLDEAINNIIERMSYKTSLYLTPDLETGIWWVIDDDDDIIYSVKDITSSVYNLLDDEDLKNFDNWLIKQLFNTEEYRTMYQEWFDESLGTIGLRDWLAWQLEEKGPDDIIKLSNMDSDPA